MIKYKYKQGCENLSTKDKKESVKLDQILKMLFSSSNKVLVKLLNSLFNEDFKENEVEITISNNEFIEESLDVLRGDMFYTATNNCSNKKANYHIEFQTKNDSTMVIRTFEYGFRKARDEANNEDDIKTIYFPKQKVIFFEENKSIEDSLKLKIVFPDGGNYIYIADVMKYWEYSNEELLEQKLYPLLPLQLFSLRKELKKLEKKNDVCRIQEISKEARVLAFSIANESARLLEQEEIFGEDLHKMLLGVRNLVEYLNTTYLKDNNLEKEVEVMTKTLYDPEVEKRGIERGIEKGKIETAKNMIKEGLDVVLIAKCTGLDIELIKKLMNK